VGNLLTGDENFHKALLRFEPNKGAVRQADEAAGGRRLDDNVYVRRGGSSGQGLMVWSPVEGEDCVTELNNLEELRRLHPEYEAHGIYVTDWYGSVFQGPELGELRAEREPEARRRGADAGGSPEGARLGDGGAVCARRIQSTGPMRFGSLGEITVGQQFIAIWIDRIGRFLGCRHQTLVCGWPKDSTDFHWPVVRRFIRVSEVAFSWGRFRGF